MIITIPCMADKNIDAICQYGHFQRFDIILWAQIYNNHLICPHHFLQEMWFMHAAYFGRNSSEYLIQTFSKRWIGYGGLVSWSVRYTVLKFYVPLESP